MCMDVREGPRVVKDGNELFKRWAKYEALYVSGVSLGYGGTVTGRIMEGKGEILPGAPKGSGPKAIHVDLVASRVGDFVKTLSRSDRELVKLYYLNQVHTLEEKSTFLRVKVREIYRRLHKIQLKVVLYMETWSNESSR